MMAMRLLVAVKQVPDPAMLPRVGDDGLRFGGVGAEAARAVLNPCDAIALEWAVQWREQGQAAAVITVAVGPGEWRETLRTTLALGADGALLLEAPAGLAPLAVARALARAVRQEGADLLVTGKQSSDGDNAQVGPMTAALLGWGQGVNVVAVARRGDELLVTREVEGGLERLALRLPTVITADLRLAEPRYASLPSIMQARRKPLRSEPWPEVVEENIRVLTYQPMPQRPPGIRVGTTKALLEALMERGVAL